MAHADNKYNLDQKAEAVAVMAKLREQGKDFKEIAKELNSNYPNIKTLTGKPWKESNVQGFYYNFRKEVNTPATTSSSGPIGNKALIDSIVYDSGISDTKKIELIKLLLSA